MSKILLFIILILTLLLVIKAHKHIDSFLFKGDAMEITFLNSNEGCKYYKNDNPYFSRMNTKDKLARKNKKNDCFLIKSNWTDKEKNVCKSMINVGKNNLQMYYPLQQHIIFTPWIFVKVSDKMENGFPHTHGNAIFLSESFLNDLVKTDDNLQDKYKRIGHVIIHEKVHVWQKENPSVFDTLYIKFLSIKKVNLSKQAQKWFENKSRTNPDGLDLNWAYYDEFDNQYYILISLWNNDNPTSLGDVQNVGIEVVSDSAKQSWKLKEDSNANIPIIPITRLPNWKEEIGLSSNHYHPNEISAEAIAKLSISSTTLPKSLKNKIDLWVSSIPY